MNKKLEDNLYYYLSEIHPNDLNLIKTSLQAFIRLVDNTELESATDNLEKGKRIEELKKYVEILKSVPSSQTAESWDETIFRKVIEKYVNAD